MKLKALVNMLIKITCLIVYFESIIFIKMCFIIPDNKLVHVSSSEGVQLYSPADNTTTIIVSPEIMVIIT